MEYLYVLKLQQGKWYIGKSANVERRFLQHKEGKGARWTQLHQPIEILYKRKLLDSSDETKTTEYYMKMYGVENVRGGTYCQVEMTPNMIASINKKIQVESEEEEESEEDEESEEETSDECFRCGREGHWVSSCYARIHVNGYMLK